VPGGRRWSEVLGRPARLDRQPAGLPMTLPTGVGDPSKESLDAPGDQRYAEEDPGSHYIAWRRICSRSNGGDVGVPLRETQMVTGSPACPTAGTGTIAVRSAPVAVVQPTRATGAFAMAAADAEGVRRGGSARRVARTGPRSAACSVATVARCPRTTVVTSSAVGAAARTATRRNNLAAVSMRSVPRFSGPVPSGSHRATRRMCRRGPRVVASDSRVPAGSLSRRP
jgi:hypothetical protein